MFGIGGCEEVKSYMFWMQRRKNFERQMKGYVAEQKVSDWQMNAWTLQMQIGEVWQMISVNGRLRKQA